LIHLAYKAPIDKARMVNEPAPGDPQRSVFYYRMSHRGEGQIPPTSTNGIDDALAAPLREWIGKLPALP
jgi:hypothetical protein